LEDERVEVKAVGEGTAGFGEVPGEYGVLVAGPFRLFADRSQCGQELLFRAVLGEEHLDDALELEKRRLRGLLEPAREGIAAAVGDSVDSAWAAAGVLAGGGRKAVCDELLGFLVDLALGARPVVAGAAFQLLGELVGGPVPQREMAEDEVGRRGQLLHLTDPPYGSISFPPMGSIGAVVDRTEARVYGEVRVRDARAGELDRVAGLLGEVYGVFRERLPTAAWASYIGEIVDVRSRLGVSELIVAEREGRLVGTIGFYPDASHSQLERWPQGWASIRTLGVLAQARRRGVGDALARECVRRARSRGLRAIGLHTAAHLAAATRLYEGLGFRRAPEFDLEIGEMFTGRSLAPGDSWVATAYRLDLRED
jgi:ribosomal protein S18 acetylase RimI-like enzyme